MKRVQELSGDDERWLRWPGAVRRSKMGLSTLKRLAAAGRFKVLHPSPRVALIERVSFDRFLEGSGDVQA